MDWAELNAGGQIAVFYICSLLVVLAMLCIEGAFKKIGNIYIWYDWVAVGLWIAFAGALMAPAILVYWALSPIAAIVAALMVIILPGFVIEV